LGQQEVQRLTKGKNPWSRKNTGRRAEGRKTALITKRRVSEPGAPRRPKRAKETRTRKRLGSPLSLLLHLYLKRAPNREERLSSRERKFKKSQSIPLRGTFLDDVLSRVKEGGGNVIVYSALPGSVRNGVIGLGRKHRGRKALGTSTNQRKKQKNHQKKTCVRFWGVVHLGLSSKIFISGGRGHKEGARGNMKGRGVS